MNYETLTKKKKCLDEYRPFPQELVKNLDDWFRIELTYTSNAIKGNTLTRRETALVLEKGLTVGGKSLVEHLEATNHAHALDWVSDQLKRKPQTIQDKDILQLHDLVLKGIDDTNAGHYRNVSVRISGSTVILPNPQKVPSLMEAFNQWFKTTKYLHPVELAAEAHYQLVTIHPFVDENGRTARLLMNLILMMSGYPPAIIRKEDRLAYIGALETAQLGGPQEPYFKLIFQAVNRSLDIYLKALQGQTEPQAKEEKLLKIGELAKQTGETPSTLRHWTKEGLLDVTEVTPAGYQLYSQKMAQRTQKIRDLQKKRYTLQEIRQHLTS